MAITLGGVTLPGDLRWTDEYQWSPVARSHEYGLTGASIIDLGVKQAGRPITLVAQNESDGYVWLDRATVDALEALNAIPDWTGTLTLEDGQTFAVTFRDEGITAGPVRHIAPHENTDPYTLTVLLQTV